MLATITTIHDGRAQVAQFEAPTPKDCLVVWAGKLELPGLDDEGRTRLRGDMADFDAAPLAGFEQVWKLELVRPAPLAVYMVETVRR